MRDTRPVYTKHKPPFTAFVEVNTRELDGGALEWVIAQIENVEIEEVEKHVDGHCYLWMPVEFNEDHRKCYYPSVCGEQALDIISRVGIDVHQHKKRPYSIIEKRHFDATKGDSVEYMKGFNREMVKRPHVPGKYDNKWFARLSVDHGPFGWQEQHFMSDDLKLSAMRCYAHSVHGEKVSIPSIFVEK
ncbi:MAG: hypothetical protein ACTS9Y_00500 [Methylophilus sp.]|uniref:hypothetical protein n=1 Tax=Methylophilus sp. TaxID=29541 RepID=UPI003FA17D50